MATNKEIAQKTVDRMLDLINTTGSLPWSKPWGKRKSRMKVFDGYTTISIPVNHWSRTGKPYHGVNNLILGITGKSGEWVTFKQCQAEGGSVNKGAKGSTILYWQMWEKDTGKVDADGNPIKETIPLLRYYTVFNVEADTNLKVKHHPADEVVTVPRSHWEDRDPDLTEDNYNQAAEDVIADYLHRAVGLTLNRNSNGDQAFYSPSLDSVTVPRVTQFEDIGEYYSTTFHELGHSTGHSSRLNRLSGKDAIAAWGDENYSREELVAEITAATILTELGLESGNSFRNSAAYVQSWASHIKDDPMMFVTAAGKAEAAINLILNRTTC